MERIRSPSRVSSRTPFLCVTTAMWCDVAALLEGHHVRPSREALVSGSIRTYLCLGGRHTSTLSEALDQEEV